MPYYGEDNNDFRGGESFCCGIKSATGADLDNGNDSTQSGITANDDPELYQYYYHADHLGSASYLTNLDGEIAQHIEYVPFGEVFLEERNNKWNSPYLFNGKELDEETGLSYYGARYYNPRESVWLSVDPKANKYPSWSPYAYTFNNPVKYVDPDGKDAILIVFPDYKVDTESFLGKQPLGHAGVLLIDNKTGVTKYYEYGRYKTSDGTKGKVRNVIVPNVKIDPKTGKPTQKSLNEVLGVISKKSGHGGRIQGAYTEGDFKTMKDYAQGKLDESSDPKNPNYDKKREPYKLGSNNCATFSCDVVNQDMQTKEKSPWIFIPTPDNVAEEYQDNFPKVDYDSKTDSTKSDIYKKDK